MTVLMAIVFAYILVVLGVYDVADNHGDKFLVKLFISIAWPVFSLYVLGRMLCTGLKKWKGFEERLEE